MGEVVGAATIPSPAYAQWIVELYTTAATKRLAKANDDMVNTTTSGTSRRETIERAETAFKEVEKWKTAIGLLKLHKDLVAAALKGQYIISIGNVTGDILTTLDFEEFVQFLDDGLGMNEEPNSFEIAEFPMVPGKEVWLNVTEETGKCKSTDVFEKFFPDSLVRKSFEPLVKMHLQRKVPGDVIKKHITDLLILQGAKDIILNPSYLYRSFIAVYGSYFVVL